MKKILMVSFLICCFTGILFAEEKITITTYYPSPAGIYQRLVTNTLGVGDTNALGGIEGTDAPDPSSNPGDLWVAGNSGMGTITTQNRLDVSGSVAIGAGYAGLSSAPTDGLLVQGNVGIGTSSPQAVLDVDSVTGGFIPPRMTASQRNSISSPQDGTIVYNTTSDKLNVYSGGWKQVGGGGYCFTNNVSVYDGQNWEDVECTCPEGWSKPDLDGDEELGLIHYCAWSGCLGGQCRPLGTICDRPSDGCDKIMARACLCCHD
jgi:hypothetical protein